MIFGIIISCKSVCMDYYFFRVEVSKIIQTFYCINNKYTDRRHIYNTYAIYLLYIAHHSLVVVSIATMVYNI